MTKEINISGIQYKVEPSMYTMWKYNQNFGRDLYDDFVELTNRVVEISEAADQNKEAMKHMGAIIDKTLKIAYTMIEENNENFKPYEAWLKDLNALGKNTNWVLEVLTAVGQVFQG